MLPSGEKNMAQSKSVLLLAYSWPPDVSVGSVRPVYLSRQFVRLGWQPIVVTVREQYYERLNTSGVMGTDSALVIRTHCLPHPRYAYLWVKKFLAWFRHADITDIPESVSDSSTDDGQAGSKPALGFLKRTILSLLYTPDEFQGWFPFALAASLIAVVRRRPQCVISTAPPFTPHLVAWALKKLCGINWIAEFRDPWSCNESGTAEITNGFSDWINRRLEKMVISCADRIVCVTPAMTERYRKLYPNLPDNKWVTITNGYDLDEFANLGSVEKEECFTISYVGNFFYNRSPHLLLKAVGELIAEGKLDRQKICIRFVGSSQHAGVKPIAEMISENKLEGVVQIVGMVPRYDALKEILRASVLLLVGTQRLTVAAKTYEYMAAGKPILAIVEEGAEADLIRYSGGGRVVAPNDLAGAKDAIAFWYDEYIQKRQNTEGYQSGSMASSDEFSWARLGPKYVSVLEECCINQ